MNEKKKLQVTAYGVWGFVFVWFGPMFFAVNVLGLIFCVIGLVECVSGKKRGIGWPIFGLFIGIVLFINFIGTWQSLNEIDGYWAINAGFLGIILLFYLLFRHAKKKKDGVISSSGAFLREGSSGTAGSASAAVTNAATSFPSRQGASPQPGAKSPSVRRPDPETVRKEVNDRTEQLKEKLLEQEALRIREEEESRRQKQQDILRKKEFKERILSLTSEEPPSEADLLTLDAQRLLYQYAIKIFPQKNDSEAGIFLMKGNIEDAETMIETVSGVMGALSERILESGSELREYWDSLERKDLLQGIKAFLFYKEMSVGNEPFEIITEDLIGYLYDKKNS